MENKKHRVLKLLTVGTLIGSVFSSAGFINAQETLEPEDPIVEEEGLEVEEEKVEETEQPIEEEVVEETLEESTEEVTEEPKEQNTENSLLRNELLRDEVTEVATGTWGTSEWSLDSEGTLTIGEGEFVASLESSRPTWNVYKDDVIKIVFSGEVIAAEQSNHLFREMTNLKSLENLENFDTSNAVAWGSMFRGCTSLESLDLSKLDTSSTVGLGAMFMGCTNLRTVNLSGWDTRNVTGLGNMFQQCSNLTEVNLDGWNTSKVSSMSLMFGYCTSIETLDLSHFDTSSVTNFSSMFTGTSNLKLINMSGWDTGKAINMGQMFYNCTSLESLDVSHFDTSNVTDMAWMFRLTTGLGDLDLSNWNTGKVTRMIYMFSQSDIKTLEQNFDTSNVTDMSYMFAQCQSLESLDINNFSLNSATTLYGMISAPNLESLDISNWDTTNVNNLSYIFAGSTKLSSITLGEKSLFNNAIGPLNQYVSSGTNYTGKWVGKNDGVTFASSTTFMSNYDGSNPDTYVWEEKLMIDFDTNGADTITSQSLTTAQSITKPEDPTKTGYEFDGWYSDEEFESKWDFDTKVTKSMTLYAKFDVIEYDISFKEDGSDFTDWSATYSTPTKYTVEDFIVLPTANDMDVASNKIFAGWYEDESLSGDSILDIATGTTENQTYYAKFVTAEENYSIQYFEGEDTFTNWKEGFSATIIYSNNETQAIDLPDVDQIEKRGYAFDGWYDNPELEGNKVTEITTEETGTKKFYAKFVPIEYDINFKEGSSNFTDWTSNYNDVPTIYTIEDEITLPTASNLLDRDGYTFAGWYDNETFEGEAVTTISEGSIGERTYYAKYEVNDYTITFMDGSSEVVNWTSGYTIPTSYTVEEGVTLPTAGNLVEKIGYTFVGWYDNAELEGTPVTSIGTGTTGNKTYYAKYEVVPYTITFMNGSEAITSWVSDYTAPSSYNIESSNITLPTKDNLVAHPNNYVFVGWYDNAEFDGDPVTIIETGSTRDKVYYAMYADVTLSITDNYQDNSDNVIVTDGSYDLEVLLNGNAMSSEELANITWTITPIGGFSGDGATYATIEEGTSTITMLKSGVVEVTATYMGVSYSIFVVRAGDINGDGTVSGLDVSDLITSVNDGTLDNLFNSDYILYLADINGDGEITALDVSELISIVGGN